jgi:hypothetical protein
MEPVDLLCSPNAWPQKDGMGSLAILLLAERAREDRPGYPVKKKQASSEVSFRRMRVAQCAQ